MKNVLIIAFALGMFQAYSQSTFKTSLEADSAEAILDIASTASGYFMTGYTTSFGEGGWDALVIKTDASGNTLWSKVFGNAEEQSGNSIVATADGGCLVLGETNSLDTTGRDIFLLKLDANGNTEWTKIYSGDRGEYAGKLIQSGDNFYVIGYTWSFGTANDGLLMKVDAGGNIIFAKHYDGGNFENLFGAALTSDGGIVMTGSRAVIVTDDALVIKTDTAGNLLWAKEYGGTGVDAANSITEATDGGYVFVGSTNSFGSGALDYYMVKTAIDGSHVWTRAPGTMSWDGAYEIINDNDGFVVLGEGYTGDYYVLHFDQDGYMDWERLYDNGGWERPFCIAPNVAGDGFITAGFSEANTTRDIHVVQFSSDGAICDGEETDETFISTQPSTVADVNVTVGTAALDILPITFTEAAAAFSKNQICQGTAPTGTFENFISETSLNIFPNPAEDRAGIEITGADKKTVVVIYDSRGALVMKEFILTNLHTFTKTIDLKGFPKGLYRVCISGEKTSLSKTLVIQ